MNSPALRDMRIGHLGLLLQADSNVHVDTRFGLGIYFSRYIKMNSYVHSLKMHNMLPLLRYI